MAEITEGITKKLEKIARKFGAGNYDDEQDCLQEALVKVLEMPDGSTESYYVQYGMRAMQNFMRKERAFRNRETITDYETGERRSLADYIHVAPWLAQSGDVDTYSRGGKTPTALELDTLKENCAAGDSEWGQHE